LAYCTYCQRWVEPTKGNSDMFAGHAGSLGGVVGTGLKGPRCPICNNALTAQGIPRYLPQQSQPYPQLVYPQHPQLVYKYSQSQHAYLPPAPRYPATPAPTTHPQVARAIPLPDSPYCPHCRRPITYAPNLQQRYCYFCQRPIQ